MIFSFQEFKSIHKGKTAILHLCFSTEKNRRLGSKKARYIRAFHRRHLFCLHSMVGAGGPELRSAFVCFANLRFIDLWFESTFFYIKIITNRIAIGYHLVGAGGPELRSAFVCFANLRFIDLWFESTFFYIKIITNRIAIGYHLVGAGGPELRSAFVCFANLRFIDLWFESTFFYIKIITNRIAIGYHLVGAGGFEPPKSSTTDLQSAPFGHSGTLPHTYFVVQNTGAGGRT